MSRCFPERAVRQRCLYEERYDCIREAESEECEDVAEGDRDHEGDAVGDPDAAATLVEFQFSGKFFGGFAEVAD